MNIKKHRDTFADMGYWLVVVALVYALGAAVKGALDNKQDAIIKNKISNQK